MHKFISYLFIVFSLVLTVSGQSTEQQIAAVDAYAQKVMSDWKQPGMAIAVVKDDKVIFQKGYGVRELGKSDLVDQNTVFAIASNSKAYTTTALAMLVDEKKLNWDDKVAKYLPEFQMYDPWVTSELTVRDLVTHRVGLDTFSGDLLWYEANFTPDEILTRIKYLKPVSSFRTRYGYQNLMFIVAGKVIEKVSGKSWCGFVTERILQPLDMSRTVCSVNQLPSNAAFPHNESGGSLRVLHRGNVDGSISAAALNSSVADVSKWIRFQLGRGTFDGKKLISADRIWELWQPYMYMPISENAAKNNPTRQFSGVGMGWFTYNYQGKKIVNHSGGLDGMLSYTVLIPEENIGFVVLTNSEFPAFSVMTSKLTDIFTGAPEHRSVTGAAKLSAESLKIKLMQNQQKRRLMRQG